MNAVPAYNRFAKVLLLAALGVLLSPSPARAVVMLDWDSLKWNTGLTMTYYATNSANASTSANKGIYYADDSGSGVASVTITLSGDTGDFNGGFPKINNNTTTGGLSPAENALQLKTDFADDTRKITVSITFNNYLGGVDSLAFSLFNIDAANNSSYVDQVSDITATLTTGSAVGANITGSANNQVAGSGTNQTITGTAATPATGANSGNANATIDFSTAIIYQANFTFGNDPSAGANPPVQSMGLHDISFKSHIPEVGTTFGVVLACGLVVGSSVRRWLKLRR